MSDKPNTVALGAFILGAALIAISALLFVSGSGWGGDKSKVVMVFDGSIKGLSVGAPLALRGVQIGQVTDIHLIFDTDSIDITTTVVAEIDGEKFETRGKANTQRYLGDEMIASGLRAQLNSQSMLTGLLYIQLDFHPSSPINLPEIDSPYSQIPTIPTDLQRITRELESMDFAGIATNIQTIADSLSSFVATEAFQNLPQDLHDTLVSVSALSGQFTTQIASSGPKLDALLEGTTELMETEIPQIAIAATTTLLLLEDAITAFEHAMLEIDDLVSGDSATTYALNKALREIALAGRELQLLAKTLDEHPEVLLRGKRKDEQ